jgi:hypothetical protein
MKAKVFEAIDGKMQQPSKPKAEPVPPSFPTKPQDMPRETEPGRPRSLSLEEALNQFLADVKKVHCIGQSEYMEGGQVHTTVTVLYD